jgi:undecaprenyl-diphosphatase
LLPKLLELDNRLSNRMRIAENPGLRRQLAAMLAHSGDSWLWGLGLGLLWLLGSADAKSLAITLLLGILITAMLVMVIKFVVRRQRPPGAWGAIYRNTDPHSFPSGHAARAVMLAVLATQAGPSWLGWLLLAWSPLVALARVAMGVHYFSDVLVGALFGVLAGLSLYPLF